jgi:hypothetical protein
LWRYSSQNGGARLAHRHSCLLAGVGYGEPFVQKEAGLAGDLTLVPAQPI